MSRRYIIVSLLTISCILLAFPSCGLFHEHSYGDWVIVKSATCIEEGLEERTCSCGAIDTLSVESIPHSWQPATCVQPKTCSICQLTEGEPTSVHTTRQGYCECCGMFINELANEVEQIKECVGDIAYHSMCGGLYIDLYGKYQQGFEEVKAYSKNLKAIETILNKYPNEFSELRTCVDTFYVVYNKFERDFNSTTNIYKKEASFQSLHKVFVNWQTEDFLKVISHYTAPEE